MKLSIKKRFRRQLRKFIQVLPEFIQKKIYRRMIDLDDNLPPEFHFKVADKIEELEQAYEIVYGSYRELDLVDKTDSSMRFTKYHLLPSTVVLICKRKEEVIATVTLITDSSIGLPADSLVDLSEYRKKGLTISEVSSLAVKKGFRKKKPGIFMALSKFMWDYSYFYAGIDIFICSLHGSIRDFYRFVLLFEELQLREDFNYSYVKDSNPSVVLLNLNTFLERTKAIYSNCPPERNIHRYFSKVQFSCFDFGQEPIKGVVTPSMSIKDIQYLASKKPSVFNEISPKDKKSIAHTYFYEEFQEALPIKDEDGIDWSKARKDVRLVFNREVDVATHEKDQIFKCKIRNISRGGAMLHVPCKLSPGTHLSVRMMGLNEENFRVRLEVLWQDGDLYGCQIIDDHNKNWNNLLDYIEGRFKSVLKTG